MGKDSQILTPPEPKVNRPDYGPFSGVAEIEQELKRTLRETKNWKKLSPAQQSAMEMIVHKMARLLNGNPNHIDSWHDIAGYANIVENSLTGNGPV